MKPSIVALNILDATGRGWRLDRIAPSTYLTDLGRAAVDYAGATKAPGRLYRCRIGTGPWNYGCSIFQAAQSAVAQFERRIQKEQRL